MSEFFFYDNAKAPSDFAADPFFRLGFFASLDISSPPVLHDDGLMYFGVFNTTLATGYIARFPPGSTMQGPELVLHGTAAPKSVVSWNGSIWWTATDDSANTVLYEWTGVVVTTVDAATSTVGLAKLIGSGIGIHQIYKAPRNLIRRVTVGGVKTNLTMPGASFGVVDKASYNSVVEYKGVIYAAGTDSTGGVIYSVSGVTVARAHTVPGGGSSIVKTLALFNDKLYFLYLNGSDAVVYLGHFDGSTWTDAHLVTTTLAGTHMVPYKGNLLLLDSTACSRSAGTDTGTLGNWVSTASTSTTNAHPNQAANEVFWVNY